jgi:hypothetical protein
MRRHRPQGADRQRPNIVHDKAGRPDNLCCVRRAGRVRSELIRELTKAGMAAARRRGVPRPPAQADAVAGRVSQGADRRGAKEPSGRSQPARRRCRHTAPSLVQQINAIAGPP